MADALTQYGMVLHQEVVHLGHAKSHDEQQSNNLDQGYQQLGDFETFSQIGFYRLKFSKYLIVLAHLSGE